MIEVAVLWILRLIAAPAVGLTSVFVVSFVSATLLPLGSEPAVFAVIKANPALYWPTIVVATLGNTLGGMVDYWIGFAARRALSPQQQQARWSTWVDRYGAKVLLLGWMPIIGDPLCTLAGWKKLPFRSSVMYMAAGKLVRYVLVTWLLLYVPDGWWHRLGNVL